MCLSLPSDALSSPFSENIKAVAISLHEISTFSILYNYSTHSTRSHPDTRRSPYPPVPESLPAPYFQAVRPRFLPLSGSQTASSPALPASSPAIWKHFPCSRRYPAPVSAPSGWNLSPNRPDKFTVVHFQNRIVHTDAQCEHTFSSPCCSACFKPNAASSAPIFVRRAIFHGFSPVLTVYASSAYKSRCSRTSQPQ